MRTWLKQQLPTNHRPHRRQVPVGSARIQSRDRAPRHSSLSPAEGRGEGARLLVSSSPAAEAPHPTLSPLGEGYWGRGLDRRAARHVVRGLGVGEKTPDGNRSKLRREMTDVETLLWSRLRGRQLEGRKFVAHSDRQRRRGLRLSQREAGRRARRRTASSTADSMPRPPKRMLNAPASSKRTATASFASGTAT